MSGGSLNYIYSRALGDLFDYSSIADLEAAAQILYKKNYHAEADDVRRLIEYILSARNRVGILREQLAPVLKAVEWCESCDISDEDLAKKIEKYRTGGEP